MTLKHNAPFTLNDDKVKHMWNHRQHLQVAQVGSPDVH